MAMNVDLRKNTVKHFWECVIDDQDYADPITAIYSNVGEYNGKIVDLKVTAVKWGPVNKNHIGNDGRNIIPCILFYKNRIAFNTIGVGTVRFRFDFRIMQHRIKFLQKDM